MLLKGLALLTIGFVTASTFRLNSTSTSLRQDVSYRLPQDVKPTHYIVDLLIEDVLPGTKTFKVPLTIITLEVVNRVATFNLHFALRDSLTFETLQLKDSEGNTIPTGHELNTLNQQLTIFLRVGELVPGLSYTLTFLDLVGDFGTDMYGFYLSEYVDKDGQPLYAAGTQFQTTHARKAFPCFDEPIFKAKFQLSITYPNEYVATMSNTAGVTENISPNLIKQQFAETPTMSSYLIAFVVSKFTVESTSASSFNYLVSFPEGFEGAADYTLSITEPIIAAMAYKTGIRYADLGIPQLFQVAMPDFSAGAMENWGLAIYRERGLLWTPEDSSNRQKQYVCTIIAHEISHMWFGDYVTTNWWSEAWLNEGFATFFEAQATAMVEPDWNIWEQFVVDDLQAIMQSDAILSSWPLTSAPEDVSTAAQISTKFSGITYSKGGSVIRMMEHFVGETKFYKALNFYLDKHQLKNTLPDDLWAAFEEQNLLTLPAEVTMKDVMSSWTEKAGFPVVTVTRSGANALLSQTRFLLNTGTDETKWYVPITYATSNVNTNFKSTAVQDWLLPTSALTINNVFAGNDWIIVNVQETGYYRVDYDENLWGQIRDLLRSDGFAYVHEVNRAQIVDDVMNLARVQSNKYGIALDITKYLEQEIEYVPWAAAFNSFSYLRKRIATTDEVYAILQDYISRMSLKLYQNVKFDITPNQNHLDVLRTVLALQWACDLDVPDCVNNAKTKFATYRETGVNVDPNLRSIVYCNAIRQNAVDDWNFLWNTFAGFKMSTEKVTIISALGCASNVDILKNYLTLSITASSGIKSQDALSVFTAVLNGNPGNVNVALDFLIENFVEISNYYGGMRSLTRIIEGIADRITLTTQVTKFRAFIEANREQLQDAAEAADAALANAEVNIAWFGTYRETVLAWLQRERGGGAATITVSLTTMLLSLSLLFVK